MLRFQDVMARFLDTQRSVMLGYLGAPGAAPPPTNGHAAPPLPPAIAQRLTQPAPSTNGDTAPAVRPAPEANGAAHHGPNGKPAATSAPSPAPASAARALDRDSLLAQLLDLVSERTGYPKEALSIDLDLEADLGIDSIKRVEILGTLADSLGTTDDAPKLEMEKLSVIKTLRGIADYVSEALTESHPEPNANGKPVKAEQHPAAAALPTSGARAGEVQRLVIQLIDVPLPDRPRLTPPAGTVLITDDGRGIARALADQLGELDVRTTLIRPDDAGLTDPAAVADLATRLRDECGPIAGLIHLLPLAEAPADARRDVKSLYLLTRALEADIRAAGQSGGAVLLTATALGGRMGYGDDLPDDFRAGHGGVAGFTKCLGYEWPEVLVRVVDLDATQPTDELAELLLSELGDPDGPFEVGRAGGERVTWQCDPGPLDTSGEPAVELGPDSTLLITGGARGITAKIAEELARRYRAHLVLVGSSAEPDEESADTANLSTPAELKTALMKRFQSEGRPPAPAAVETAYRRLLKDREMRANLAAIRAAGGQVEYRAVDVRDTAAFGNLIDELNRAGGIAGVIHGAGVIDDKLLRDKTPESFERVFGTKIDSALTLAQKLDPARLKFCLFFASITSRYGNRGQSDYAAANEVLSKLACDLDRRWPGRVASIAWGPWSGVGMVADLEKHLVARGLKLISPEAGAKFAVDEAVYGRKGVPEVVIAGGSEQAARPARSTESATVGAE
jgi:NAD(P)-dependent dehydrogenase (short-subunit alcohol dehydrogenase family)/acyl carrier protein